MPKTDEQVYKITGMNCASCVSRVEKAIRGRVSGVEDVSVNLSTGEAYVTGSISGEAVVQAVEAAGYQAQPLDTERPSHDMEDADAEARGEYQNFLIALALTLPVFVISMFHLAFPGSNWVQFVLTTPVMFWSGRRIFAQALKLARRFEANMDTLVALGTGAAYLASLAVLLDRLPMEHVYFESAAVIITLILLGRYLEARAKSRAGEAIRRLMAVQPANARVKRNGDFQEIPVDEVRLGDILLVKPGEQIPVDGEVIEGHSAVNEAMVTGESMPVAKQPGDTVIGGTLNSGGETVGSLTLQATRVGAETTLSRIIRLVERAQSSKAPIQRIADKVAGMFVPIVIVLATLTLIAWLITGNPLDAAMSAAIAVLVISCPCAMGLATPTAVQVGTGKAASMGILIRNAQSLENALKLDVLILDKTGTLTEGRPAVTDILNHAAIADDEFLRLAASLENRSEHPLARAVLNAARKRELRLSDDVDKFASTTGAGISGTVNGRRLLVGNEKFLTDQGVDPGDLPGEAEALAESGKTPLLVAIEGRPAGIIAVADPIKPTSKEAVRLLKDLGILPVMVTGDREGTAQAIAGQAGISQVHAEITPEGKLTIIKTFQRSGKKVGMVGDGINDAPALAQADVGFAVGGGTDVALEAADITLMEGDIIKAAEAIELSRRTMRTIRQNLFWAFFYNVIAIPVAALGLLVPMIAAGAMAFSSVFVVTNSLRLKGFRSELQSAGISSSGRMS